MDQVSFGQIERNQSVLFLYAGFSERTTSKSLDLALKISAYYERSNLGVRVWGVRPVVISALTIQACYSENV